jgi:chaperone modulatory protein CbpM
MIPLDAVLARLPDLADADLIRWVEHRWVLPETDEDGVWQFREIDIARIHLIHDIHRDLDVPEDTIPLVLSLLDQVYDLRRTLRILVRGVATQPPEIRAAVLAAWELDETPPPEPPIHD